jgi:predicted DNA-binding protein (MmcQ/YjbR family)
MMDRQIVFDYIKKRYKVLPEYPWHRYDSNAVFRHTDNKKWFALVMDVQRDKLGLCGDDGVDVVNLKMDDMFFRDMIIREDGILPAWHMNKIHWITVLLDGTVPDEKVFELIDMSFLATASAKKKEKIRPPKEWLIPSNPKYYDIIHAFDDTDVIDWKQGAGIKKGDTVFMYVGAPVSAILYRCKVTETNIPYQYQDKNLTITALMKIRLLKRYDPDRFTFDVLKSEYGIYAVRGPRGVPNSLSEVLEK